MTNRRKPFYPDDSDYNTNAPSYYDDLARKSKLIQLLSERIWEYEKTLDMTLEDIEMRVSKRFDEWDLRIEKFPENVEDLLKEWMEDGTLDHIINDTIFNWKADKEDLDKTNKILSQKAIYITEFGAIGNANYYNITDNQYYVDSDFTILANDDTESFKNAIKYVEENGRTKINIPTGNFWIKSTINLNKKEMILEGEGRNVSNIFYSGLNSPLFYIHRIGNLSFKEITFRSPRIDNNSTAFHFHMNLPTDVGKPTYQFYFDSCTINYFYQAVDLTGNELCSEMVFNKVRFHNNYNVFRVANIQALNHQFIGCDFENLTLGGEWNYDTTTKPLEDSIVFDIVRSAMINIFGGSIITYGTTFFINPDGDGRFQRHSNGKINVYGGRWEMLEASEKNVLFRHSKNYSLSNWLNINIHDSIIYQRSPAQQSSVGELYNNMNVSIENTHFYRNAIIEGIVNSATAQHWGTLLLKNISQLTYKEVKTSDASTSHGITHHVKNELSVFNDGVANDYEFTPIGYPKTLKRIMSYNRFGQLPANNGVAMVTIPKKSVIHKAVVSRYIETNIDTVYTFTNEDETITYGSVTIPRQGGSRDVSLGDILLDNGGIIKISVTGASSVMRGFIGIDYY